MVNAKIKSIEYQKRPNTGFSGHGSCPFGKNDGLPSLLGAADRAIALFKRRGFAKLRQARSGSLANPPRR